MLDSMHQRVSFLVYQKSGSLSSNSPGLHCKSRNKTRKLSWILSPFIKMQPRNALLVTKMIMSGPNLVLILMIRKIARSGSRMLTVLKQVRPVPIYNLKHRPHHPRPRNAHFQHHLLMHQHSVRPSCSIRIKGR